MYFVNSAELSKTFRNKVIKKYLTVWSVNDGLSENLRGGFRQVSDFFY